MDLALLSALNEARTARRAVVVVTVLGSGAQRLLGEAEIEADPLRDALRKALRSGRSMLVTDADGVDVFLNVQAPPARIVAIGAVHISQALAPMARIAGFDIEVVDPRTAFAAPERFPGTVLRSEWPEQALSRRRLDDHTALVALTHDPKIDDYPIENALRAQCFYVGALGSRKTHQRRVERLRANGLPDAMIDRIEAPVGLDIASSTPAEIAVSILASVIRAFRTRGVMAA